VTYAVHVSRHVCPDILWSGLASICSDLRYNLSHDRLIDLLALGLSLSLALVWRLEHRSTHLRTTTGCLCS
jgi:hypothetical protein